MAQVIPPGMGAPPEGRRDGAQGPGQVLEGVVEKLLSPGNAVVLLEDGRRVSVRGPLSLAEGDEVVLDRAGRPGPLEGPAAEGRGIQWSASIPFGFGGDGAGARLEVFVERAKEGARGPQELASYFVFTVVTEMNGEVQWGIHLKGRQASLQVHAKGPVRDREALLDLVRDVERGLSGKGFVLSGPALWSDRPVQVPKGYRLDLVG